MNKIFFILCLSFSTIIEAQKIDSIRSKSSISEDTPLNKAGLYKFKGSKITVNVPVDFMEEYVIEYIYGDTWQFWLKEIEHDEYNVEVFTFDEKAIVENQESIRNIVSRILLGDWDEFSLEPNSEEKVTFVDHINFKSLNHDGVLLNYKSTNQVLSYFYLKMDKSFVVAKLEKSNKENMLKIRDFINSLSYKE